MDPAWRQWLSRTFGVPGRGGDERTNEPRFADPLTIDEFETLRDEAPTGMEVMSGSTTWMDDQERITALVLGERTSNEAVLLRHPLDADGWEEFETERDETVGINQPG